MKEHLAAEGMEFTYYHCANSASIIDMPKLGMNLERAGISTYGLYPSDEVNKEAVPLRPAMELIAHVTYVKWIEKGTEVSYGGTCCPEKDADRHDPDGIWRRIPTKSFQQRICSDPWSEGTDPWQSLYGSVYGRCDRNSGCEIW